MQITSNTAILIPARYGSTRFPGKPLCKLGDKTMIERVYDTCKESGFDTYVLTDNKTIAQCVQSAGGSVYIDSKDYENGTERCAGAIKSILFDDYDNFINVQGDMPDVTIDMINKAAQLLNQYSVSTVVTSMPEEEQNNPNSVKLIRAVDLLIPQTEKCLWFGRGMTGYGDWHLGVYGYTRDALKKYDSLTITKEEELEKLEQLRWLKNGWNIGVLPVIFNGIEINTKEDLTKWQLMHQS